MSTAKMGDVELEAMAKCRRWLDANGITAGNWTLDWDGGEAIYITAHREGKSLREFKVTPEDAFERDPYIESGAPQWNPIPELEEDVQRGILREFVQWFDSRFPKDTKNPPGLPLYMIAEKARKAL